MTRKRGKNFGIKLTASFFFLGYCPLAPGTAGAVGGLALYFIFSRFSAQFPPRSLRELSAGYLVFLAGFFLAGVVFSALGEKVWKRKDSSYIVIDEAFSIFITLFCLPVTVPILAGGLVLNRIFDIYKPWPLKRLERLRGGWGVMLDDLGAGIYSHLVLRALFLIATVWIQP